MNMALLAEDKYMPGMHLRQPEFTYRACGPFTKNKNEIKNIKKRDLKYIHWNELDKAYFQHDIA